MFRRRRFADVIRRQLELFQQEEAGLIEDCIAAEERYNRADRDEAEELYGDYVDLVEAGTEALADIRDTFARTLDEDTAEEYEAEIASWGFSLPGPGIDHILVRGASSSPETKWPKERRTIGGALVSDHAPVDVTVE
jgi:endonuclease/exonuclease/phosphatase family metal-dependent hydrolase